MSRGSVLVVEDTEEIRTLLVTVLERADAIVLAVAHDEYKRQPLDTLLAKLKSGGLVADVKCQLDALRLREKGIDVWRL